MSRLAFSETSEDCEPRVGKFTSVLPWAILTLGLIGTFALRHRVRNLEDRVATSTMELAAEERHQALKQRIDAVEETLIWVSSLFASRGVVTREEFRDFVAPMLERDSSIQGLGWNPVVRHEDRAGHERAGREAGLEYQITERVGTGKMVRAQDRALYYPAYYLEPRRENEAAYGFDVGSEAGRRSALERAAREGAFTITQRLTLVQDPARRPIGFLAFFPHYKPGSDTSTPANRIAALDGFIVGVFRMPDIVRAGLQAFEAKMDVEITDLDAPLAERELFVQCSEPRESTTNETMYDSQHVFGGRNWQIRLCATPSFRASLTTWASTATWIVGGFITLLLAFTMFLVNGHTRRVELEGENTRRAEAALRASEESLRLTVDAVCDGAWDWDVQSDRVVLSDSWRHAIDDTDSSTSTGFWNQLVHEDDRDSLADRLGEHLRGSTPGFEAEIRLRMKSGNYRVHLRRGEVVRRGPDGSPERMVGTDTDITERKRQEQERLGLMRGMQRAQKLESLGILAGGVAHDFNNLLTTINGRTELALQLADSPAAVEEHLEQVRVAVRRAAELTREMLAYAGQGTVKNADVELSQVVSELTNLLSASLSKKARLERIVETEAWVHGDVTQLRQVVMNLLTNASDALGTDPGTIRLRTGIEQVSAAAFVKAVFGSDRPAGQYAYVEVEDNGCGMRSEIAERIFDPFYTTKKLGRGLGLAAVAGIVSNHDGAVFVDSEVGRGTRIRVVLPAIEARIEEAATDEAARPPENRGTNTVLIVDDEQQIRQMARTALESRGFTILEARDGIESVDVFHRHADEIDVVLMDLSMPRMNGNEAAREILRSTPGTQIVLTSGYLDLLELDEDVNALPFLSKPYTIDRLLEVVSSCAQASAAK